MPETDRADIAAAKSGNGDVPGEGDWLQNLMHRLLRRCHYVDVLDTAGRYWHVETVFAQAAKMKLDGLANFPLDILDGATRGYAAGKIRDVCGVVALGLLDHDGVTHSAPLSG
jgi:hypothetical protein